MRSTFSPAHTNDRYSKMLRVFLVFVAACCSGFLTGCANSKPAHEVSDDSPMMERNRANEVHGEVGVMYGNNLGRR
jgi:hypothetical protein